MPPARKYETAAQMQEGVDAYFIDCEARDKPATVSGLALWLGFESRQGLVKYANETIVAPDEEKRAFANTVKRAKSRIEAQIEEGLLEGKSNPAGKIFNLKNNFGWTDKVEHHSTVDNTITVKVEGLPTLPMSAVSVLSGQTPAIDAQSVTESVTDAEYVEVE